MTDPTLHRLLRLFATLTPLAGCGININQFSEDLCNGEPHFLEHVVPAAPVDYLELAQNYGGPSTLLHATGERCRGSTSPADCETAFLALTRTPGFPGPTHGNLSLAYTRGDETAAILDEASLRGFLGPIDSAADAALLLTLLDSRHSLVCTSENDAGPDGRNFILHTRTGHGCGEDQDIEEHVVRVTPDGSFSVIATDFIERGNPQCVVGRRPLGLRLAKSSSRRHPVGRYLAAMASLEAAAVPAFGQLARDLQAHDAPTSLVHRALRARADERRHAAIIAKHARRHGVRPQLPSVSAPRSRSLADVAAENASEGCVRETWGALVAHLQTSQAEDAELRHDLRRIAADETRHAALSWDVDAWARSRLPTSARTRLDHTASEAARVLREELTQAFDPAVHHLTGLPEPHTAVALFDQLYAGLRA